MSKLLVFAALVAAAVAQTPCQNYALANSLNASFGWLLHGEDPALQKKTLTDICANETPAQKQIRAEFFQILGSLREMCAPSVNGTVGPVELIFDVLEGVLCKKVDGQLCGLSVFALFDFQYFASLASVSAGQVPPLPDLTKILAEAPRKAAICASDTCSALIEQYASTFYRPALDKSDAAGLDGTKRSLGFVKQTVNRMRCGCFMDSGRSCHTSEALAATLDSATNTLRAAAVCDDHGGINGCGRNLITCNDLPRPTCTVTEQCNGISAALEFDINNLNRTCFFDSLKTGALDALNKDLQINLLGTLAKDFTCECPESPAGTADAQTPANHLHCSCVAKCINTRILAENLSLRRILDYATNFVVQSPTLDELLPKECKFDGNKQTYGESTTFKVSIEENAAAHLSIGFSALLALLSIAIFY